MIAVAAVVAVQLITFHTVDGRFVEVNPTAVQELIHPREPRHVLMVEGVNCVIVLAGHYVSVAETCEEVQRKIEGDEP